MRAAFAILLAVLAGRAGAGVGVSPSFAFDARYRASGLSPADWQAHQVEKVSARFSAATTVRIVDANGNGIADAWEALYGLAGDAARAEADPDGDGRTNLQEYNAGTNPVLADDWTRSTAVADAPFVADTRVFYTGGNPTFGAARVRGRLRAHVAVGGRPHVFGLRQRRPLPRLAVQPRRRAGGHGRRARLRPGAGPPRPVLPRDGAPVGVGPTMRRSSSAVSGPFN